MELKTAIYGYALEDVTADALPAVALQALEDGYVSPSLCQLAAAQGLDTRQLRVLFSKALDELGMSMPSRADAGLAAARSIAKQVLDGNLTAYMGAKKIWVEIYTRIPELVQLRPFVGFASEYEDDERHQEEYGRMIVEECKALISG